MFGDYCLEVSRTLASVIFPLTRNNSGAKICKVRKDMVKTTEME